MNVAKSAPKPIIDVIIPAYNEENSIDLVIKEIPSIVREVIVVNNNSSDSTSRIAREAGATVVDEPISGYGRACLRGIERVKANQQPPDIIVFLDADYSDFPAELLQVVQPITEGDTDMVIGSRALGKREAGSMTFPQIFGNWLATRLIKIFYGHVYTDLGPFRAIRWTKLLSLRMEDKTFGWTIEMQIKAVKSGLKITEVPVNYKKRIGISKISGTIKGTVMAGYKIIGAVFKYL